MRCIRLPKKIHDIDAESFLADDVELPPAGTAGVFGEGGRRVGDGGGRLFLFGSLLLLPEPAAVGVTIGGLGIFFGLADACGVFGPLAGFGGAGLLHRFALGAVGFGGALGSL